MDLFKHIKPLAGGTEWPIWRRKICDLLDYHDGALDVIDGVLKKPLPLENDATESSKRKHREDSERYRKANSYAKSMITSAVSDEIYQKIMDSDTALEAWNALKNLFEASSKDQVFKICMDFFSYNWTMDNDVSMHIAQLKSLWCDLNNGLRARNEDTLPELLLVCKIMQILPEKFENFKSSWMLLTKNEERTFDEMTAQLCMYERNFKKSGDNKDDQEALVVKNGNGRYEKQTKKEVKKQEGTCNYCYKKGHWVRNCRKWIADGRPPKSKNHNTNVALHSVSYEANATDHNSDWWIDNGATRHVTNSMEMFIEFEQFKSPNTIKAAGSESLRAVGKGLIKIASRVNNENLVMKLHDVWYVPDISKNLFSVLACHDRNNQSIFKSTTTKCTFEVNGQVVLYGYRAKEGSLYKADFKPMDQRK